ACLVSLSVVFDFGDCSARPAVLPRIHPAPHPRFAAAFVVENPAAVGASLQPREGAILNTFRYCGQNPSREKPLSALVPERCRLALFNLPNYQRVPFEPSGECFPPPLRRGHSFTEVPARLRKQTCFLPPARRPCREPVLPCPEVSEQPA